MVSVVENIIFTSYSEHLCVKNPYKHKERKKMHLGTKLIALCTFDLVTAWKVS